MASTSCASSYSRGGRPAKLLAGIVVVGSLLGGCVSPDVAPIGAQGTPYQPDADERRLWSEAEKEQEKLAKLSRSWDDPGLDAYLSSVAAKLMPEAARQAGAPAARVVVLRDPTLNAFSMPTGTVYIHTGLLSRLENESQLAMILAHELTHVTNRHAFKFMRDPRSKQVFSTMAGIAAALGLTPPAGIPAPAPYVSGETLRAGSNVYLGHGLPLAYIAAVHGFGRDLEREADREGMERMVASGYDPREAPRAFELLRNDHGESGRLESFFFGNRAQLDERIATTGELGKTRHARADTAPRAADAPDFAFRTRILVRENAVLDLHAGRFALASAQLGRALGLAPTDPVTHLSLGDLYRLRAQRAKDPGEASTLLARARAAYERAAELDATYPDPFRQLGLLYYQSKDTERAKTAFRTYLRLRPDAPDARRIGEYLTELER